MAQGSRHKARDPLSYRRTWLKAARVRDSERHADWIKTSASWRAAEWERLREQSYEDPNCVGASGGDAVP